MSLFIIPASLALLIKLAVLYAASSSQSAEPLTAGSNQPDQRSRDRRIIGIFGTMVLVMAGHNIAEVLGHLNFAAGSMQDSILRWYYLMTVCSLAMIVLYAKSVSRLHVKGSLTDSLVTAAVLASSVVLSLLFMFSDLLVTGAVSIGYTMTAERAELYWLFQIFAVVGFATICTYLIRGYNAANTHKAEIQCAYTLLALTPIVACSLIVIVLMNLGFKVNGAAIMPLSTAAFLVITLKGERVHEMMDIRRFMPNSLERRTSAKIMHIFSQYAQDQASYRDAMNEIEKLLVTHKHQKHHGNVSSTAASMDLPRSSLYSIFRRLEIDLKEEK